MLFKKKIGLRLDTTPDQTRLVRAALREMLLAHPRITDQPARIVELLSEISKAKPNTSAAIGFMR